MDPQDKLESLINNNLTNLFSNPIDNANDPPENIQPENLQDENLQDENPEVNETNGKIENDTECDNQQINEPPISSNDENNEPAINIDDQSIHLNPYDSQERTTHEENQNNLNGENNDQNQNSNTSSPQNESSISQINYSHDQSPKEDTYPTNSIHEPFETSPQQYLGSPSRNIHSSRSQAVNNSTNYSSFPSSPRCISTARSPRRPRGNVPSPEAVVPISRQFLQNKPVKEKDPNVLAVVVRDLERERDTMIMNGELQKSLKVQNAVETARAQQLGSLKKSFQEEEFLTFKTKEDETRVKFNQTIQELQIEQKKMEEQIQNQLNTLKERQSREIVEHDREWASEIKTRQYNRSSQRLRVLRLQQSKMIKGKMFVEASQVGQIADQLQQLEAAQNYRAMLMDYNSSIALLQQKHKFEIDTFSKASDTIRGEFKHKKEISLRPYENRIKNLMKEEEGAADPDKVWNRYHRNDGDPVQLITGELPPKVQLRTASVSDYNLLQLPPLPLASQKGKTKDELAQTH